MKRGPKAELPSTKLLKGTYQPSRDGDRIELIEPDALPLQPSWLTEAGQEVWLDEIGRVAGIRLLSENDSTMFANYCNLQGAIVLAWRSGAVPPAAYLMEARKMAEQFGLFGARSRIKGGAAESAKTINPFAALG